MKTHVKLLVLAMVLVMFTLCLAACGGGGDTTTTTEAPATTTAATTTAASVGAFEVEVTAENKYTGKEITPVYVAEKPVGTKTSIVYAKVDANNNVIATLPAGEKPVDCGNYTVTVTLSWTGDRSGALPAPFVGNFTIVPGSLATANADDKMFSAKDIDVLFKNEGMNFDPIDSALAVGFLPTGLNRVATIEKLADKDDASGTATAVAGKITSADGAGYFKVTLTYVEAAGVDNYTDENTVSHTAIVYAREITKTVNYVATAPALDGVIDTAYGAALFTTKHQPVLRDNTGKYLGIDTDNLVDPYQFAAMADISKGSQVTDDYINNNLASASFYAVWDGTDIYIAIKIVDKTPLARQTAYTAQPNPWVNDNLELYYSFGGDAVPDISQVTETYPTYKTLVRDSASGNGAPTAIKSQKSHEYDKVQCFVTTYGEGVNDANTYVIEYKIPAKSEGYTGTPGGTDYATTAGSPLVAGDFIFLAYQLNDLTGLPFKRLKDGAYNATEGTLSETERWTTTADYDALIGTSALETQKYAGKEDARGFDPATQTAGVYKWYNFENDAAAYCYAAGNRGVSAVNSGSYLRTDGCAPMILALGAAD